MKLITSITLALSLLLSACILDEKPKSPPSQGPKTFTQAKKIAREQIYFDQNKSKEGTIYCGCQWQWAGTSGGRIDLTSCHYQVRKQEERAKRIEWEHIVPAWVFGHQRQCWQKGGRKNCVDTDPTFRAIESDLHNLAPSIGEVNADRSNFSYGMLPKNQPKQYGQCTSKVDSKMRTFEPRDEVKGQVARVYFYVHERYKLDMSRQQQQLMMAWNKAYPVNKWEQERDNRIAKITGVHNPYVTGEKTWVLKASKQADNTTASTPSKKAPFIKANTQSKIYHFANCSGYKTLKAENAEHFDSAKQAEKQGYHLAKNCKLAS